jgi:hypothetical protein
MEFIMPTKKCAACSQFFKTWPQTPQQKFCSKPECQRERRRLNKQSHREVNPEAHAKESRVWATMNPDYWKNYRAGHPAYVERNRKQQKQRNQLRRQEEIPNIEAMSPGRYLLTPLDGKRIAKRASWVVEITVLSVFQHDG